MSPPVDFNIIFLIGQHGPLVGWGKPPGADIDYFENHRPKFAENLTF